MLTTELAKVLEEGDCATDELDYPRPMTKAA